MKCVQFPSALALLGLGLVLCGHGAASQPDQDQKLDFDLELRHHRLLQRARAAGLVVQVSLGSGFLERKNIQSMEQHPILHCDNM